MVCRDVLGDDIVQRTVMDEGKLALRNTLGHETLIVSWHLRAGPRSSLVLHPSRQSPHAGAKRGPVSPVRSV